MEKSEFLKKLTEAAAQVKLEKGKDACVVYCKHTLPVGFPARSLEFSFAFHNCLKAEEGTAQAAEAAEKAWEIHHRSQQLGRSS